MRVFLAMARLIHLVLGMGWRSLRNGGLANPIWESACRWFGIPVRRPALSRVYAVGRMGCGGPDRARRIPKM